MFFFHIYRVWNINLQVEPSCPVLHYTVPPTWHALGRRALPPFSHETIHYIHTVWFAHIIKCMSDYVYCIEKMLFSVLFLSTVPLVQKHKLADLLNSTGYTGSGQLCAQYCRGVNWGLRRLHEVFRITNMGWLTDTFLLVFIFFKKIINFLSYSLPTPTSSRPPQPYPLPNFMFSLSLSLTLSQAIKFNLCWSNSLGYETCLTERLIYQESYLLRKLSEAFCMQANISSAVGGTSRPHFPIPCCYFILLDLAQVLYVVSTFLWAHMGTYSVVSESYPLFVVIYYLWLSDSF